MGAYRWMRASRRDCEITHPLRGDEALQAAAQVVRETYTPEEKTAFAAWLAKATNVNKAQIATTAGLQDVAVRQLVASLRSDPDALGMLINVQQQRLRYAELAAQLETYSASAPAEQKTQLLVQAAENWRLAVNAREELRVRELIAQRSADGNDLRYGQLLLSTAPARFIQSGLTGNVYKLANSDVTMKLIAAQAPRHAPVWARAYTALTGVYFNDHGSGVASAFNAVLGPRT
jgi:hypothetical protein